MVRILALDLGSHTGWAYCDQYGVITHGVKCFLKNDRVGIDPIDDFGKRIYKFYTWLYDRMEYGVDILAYEHVVRNVSFASSHMYGAFQGIVAMMGYHKRARIIRRPPSAIKKFITNKGTASKQEVIAAVRGFGLEPHNDNDADALALLLFIQKVC